ncbi:MAG: rod shape-determining protein MreC [Oscillospiraceae bacterium]|nr:rod shape-determining protein MreC [Oscillospiraceae bacterium]
MHDFFRSVKFKIILALTALLTGAVIYSVTTEGFSTTSSYLFEMLFAPVKAASTRLSERISVSLDMVINAEKYYNENKQLKEQIGQLYGQMVDYDRLVNENGDLRTMLGLQEEHEDYRFSPPCTVIARATNDPFAAFTVDKGSDDGIKPGDPVITQNGIVGVCSEVSPGTAKIRTLYFPKTSVGAYTVRTKTDGLVSGGYEHSADGRVKFEHIDKDADIAVGDIVVTSGSENFPAGQVVGVVESVAMETNGLSQYAVIVPAVDPRTVQGVFVIIDYSIDEATAVRNEAKKAETEPGGDEP